jgi:HK97 family phage major capsid protein
MPYNNIISRDDKAALIPVDISREIFQSVPAQSAVLQLARRLPDMSTNQRRLPVMSALATAYFVTGDTGLKHTTEVNWESKYIDAEELAVIVPIPETVIDDQSYDIWSEIRPSIAEAFGKAIDEAVLFGSNIPATWTVDLGGAGLTAVCNTAGQRLSLAAYTDLYEALLGETPAGVDGCVMMVEADGYMVNGYIATLAMRGMLRNLRDTDGNLIFKSSVQEGTQYSVDGEPMYFPVNGCWGVAANNEYAFMGDWSKLVYAFRQDLTYKVLDQAVIQDGAGNIVYNLAQQDMVALRCVMRLGFALPNPINRLDATAATRCAFSVLTA